MTTKTLSREDVGQMLRLGKNFGRAQTEEARSQILREAAEFYILAKDEHEERALRFWWIEGVRDYALGQDVVYQWEMALDQKVWVVSQEEVGNG